MNPNDAHDLLGRTVESIVIRGASLVNREPRSYMRARAEAELLFVGPPDPCALRPAHDVLCGDDARKGGGSSSAHTVIHGCTRS